jgi:ferredoxin-type protein NapH
MNRQKKRLVIAVVMAALFPLVFYYFSPYLVIMGATEGIIAGDVLVFAGLFLTSLFVGRAWCGWACPAGAVQQFCSKANGKNYNGKKRNVVKYLIWVPWLSIIAVMFVQAGGVKMVDPLYQTYYGISISNFQSAIMFIVILAAFSVFALTAGKWAACHTICWMAPFMIVGRKIRNSANWPSLQLRANQEKCANCKTCNNNCSMSLDVNAMVQQESMENSECILCGACVDSCPKGVIKYSFGKLKFA